MQTQLAILVWQGSLQRLLSQFQVFQLVPFDRYLTTWSIEIRPLRAILLAVSKEAALLSLE